MNNDAQKKSMSLIAPTWDTGGLQPHTILAPSTPNILDATAAGVREPFDD